MNAKVKALFPHPDGDFHTMINVRNAAEWTYHQTKDCDIKNETKNQQMIKVWGKLNMTRRFFLMLKEHQDMIIEKCCKLLGTTNKRVLGPPRPDKMAASRPSLAVFRSYKTSLMVRELAGHYVLGAGHYRLLT